MKGNISELLALIITLNVFHVNMDHEKKPGLIYVLLWSSHTDVPFSFWSAKRKSLISNNCTFQNCYIVKDRGYFMDMTNFDVILFNVAPSLVSGELPLVRSDNQLYFFVGMEPAAYWSVLDEKFNWFFNYTWTYRLDSDIPYPYFVVRNRRRKIVAPKINARWRSMSMMKPTKLSVINQLKNKTLAAAWFVTNCRDINKRLSYGHSVNEALMKYNLSVDIYGACGNKVCSKNQIGLCLKMIENKYYFYFSFENSNSEDYVTEKVMTALDYYAVPIVYGGANYSEFMSDGMYINANVLTPEEVAEKINEIIQDKQKYHDYFRWRRYYTYRRPEGGPEDPLCTFCAFVNEDSTRNQRRVYARFTKWWNEYRSQHKNEEIIVKFEDSGPSIKSVLTYREQKVEPHVDESQSSLDQVNSFWDDVFNYYFGA